MIHLKDYRPPAFAIPRTDLDIDIQDAVVRVSATLTIERAPDSPPDAPLVLNGEQLVLVSVAIDERQLQADEYVLTDKTLTIGDVPSSFTLHTIVEIEPAKNTALEGLYQSGQILCTQNEPEGFRRITFFQDRPDCMSSFSTTITADKQRYPYLLSNGNLLSEEELADGRHRARWHDPFVKPSYLYALVAGDFARTEDSFTTVSGRDVAIHVYVDHGNEDKVSHTIESLKRAMRWDEEVFGLEYDLDLFMIVAVDAFNFGAMENKGLNVFNSACALANPDTATDGDFQNIEAIVAHEYFHNWTGDRITLRDWFQLTLKEGLTVYRDSRYMADIYSAAIQRIQRVTSFRGGQFAEDAGPNAHPIQPKSYAEINNFYTATVYSKGAQVIRMLDVLLGRDGFRKGMDRYVEKYDGKAITTEDFLSAMEEANDTTLTQFRRWYHQAGTPICKVNSEYDPARQTFTLTVQQHCEPTADGSPKEPLYFPMTMAMLDSRGNELPLRLSGESRETAATTRVLTIEQPEQAFVFTDIAAAPCPSLFRDFSAPVKVEYPYTREDLTFLFKHDSDPFNRFDAGQRLATGCLVEMVNALRDGKTALVPDPVLNAYGPLLDDDADDLSFSALALTLPTISVLCQELDEFDVQNVYRAREIFKAAMTNRHSEALRRCYDRCSKNAVGLGADAVAKRGLRNACLYYLSYLADHAVDLAAKQFDGAMNMTDRMGALLVLCQSDTDARQAALDAFLDRYRDDFNVINKWFGVQASAVRCGNLLNTVKALLKHPLFDINNPNRCRSVYGAFAGSLPAFHAPAGSGYKLIADAILTIDPKNSTVAAGMANGFKHYRRLPAQNKAAMKVELDRISETPDLSEGLREIISKTLQQS